jgi:hypothetical protein
MQLLQIISIVGVYLLLCETLEYVTVRRKGVAVYPPKIGWRLARWLAIALGAFIVAAHLFHQHQSQSNDAPLWLGLLFILLGAVWPRTVRADASGISSCSTFGFRERTIRWDEVKAINSDWEEVRTHYGFTFMGTRIYVLSRTGSQIVHGIVQSRQARFLDELRNYLPREAFAAGLYEWHP